MTNRNIVGDRLRPPYSSSTSQIKGCFCCLFLLLIFVLLLAVAATLIVILVLRPKKPEFDLQHVGVEYLLLEPTVPIAAGESAPAAYLSLNITLMFTAVNPNKVGINYKAVELNVMHKGMPVGVATVPGFEQPAQSTRTVETRVSVSRFNVMQADAAEIVRDATVNDRVELQVAGDVGAKILFLGFSSPRVQVSLFCVIVISPKKQTLTYKQCGVDGLNV